jgi:hypothetical protein
MTMIRSGGQDDWMAPAKDERRSEKKSKIAPTERIEHATRPHFADTIGRLAVGWWRLHGRRLASVDAESRGLHSQDGEAKLLPPAHGHADRRWFVCLCFLLRTKRSAARRWPWLTGLIGMGTPQR